MPMLLEVSLYSCRKHETTTLCVSWVVHTRALKLTETTSYLKTQKWLTSLNYGHDNWTGQFCQLESDKRLKFAFCRGNVLGRGRFLAIKQYTYKSVNLPNCPVKVIFPSPPIRVASTNMISPPIAVHAKPSETNNHLFQLSSQWYFSLQYYLHIRTELLASLALRRCLQGRGGGKESCAFRELRICTQPKTRELQISSQLVLNETHQKREK